MTQDENLNEFPQPVETPLNVLNTKVLTKYKKGLQLLLKHQDKPELKFKIRTEFETLEDYYSNQLKKRGLIDVLDENYTIWTMIDGARAYIELSLPEYPVNLEYLQYMINRADEMISKQK